MPLNKQYIIGVDGGGTKTRAVIGTKEGEVLAYIDGEGTNIKSTPTNEVRRQIKQLLECLMQKVGTTKKRRFDDLLMCSWRGSSGRFNTLEEVDRSYFPYHFL